MNTIETTHISGATTRETRITTTFLAFQQEHNSFGRLNDQYRNPSKYVRLAATMSAFQNFDSSLSSLLVLLLSKHYSNSTGLTSSLWKAFLDLLGFGGPMRVFRPRLRRGPQYRVRSLAHSDVFRQGKPYERLVGGAVAVKNWTQHVSTIFTCAVAIARYLADPSHGPSSFCYVESFQYSCNGTCEFRKQKTGIVLKRKDMAKRLSA